MVSAFLVLCLLLPSSQQAQLRAWLSALSGTGRVGCAAWSRPRSFCFVSPTFAFWVPAAPAHASCFLQFFESYPWTLQKMSLDSWRLCWQALTSKNSGSSTKASFCSLSVKSAACRTKSWGCLFLSLVAFEFLRFGFASRWYLPLFLSTALLTNEFFHFFRL